MATKKQTAKRPGAKPKPRGEKFEAITLRVHPLQARRLRALAKRSGCSLGETLVVAMDALETAGTGVANGVSSADRPAKSKKKPA